MARELRRVGEAVGAEAVRCAQAALRLDTLEDILRFGLAAQPAWEIVDVIVQDEFTHDVVVGVPAGRFLVFDTT